MAEQQQSSDDLDVPNPDCAFCAHNRSFEMPEALVRAAKRGNLTIFAGAGVSTESSLVFPTTFYEELKDILDWDPEDTPTFPQVMSAYEVKFGRRQLIREIAERLDYVESFPFITLAATRFHRELCTISHINQVITTNWDTAFEDYCQARPFVVDEDYAFYDLPGRKVFKIHGSIRNVSSLIATNEDYSRREQEFQTSAMGSSLKHFLATETVVFIGFSLSDPDFQNVYRGLLQGLARSRPPAYLVTPFGADQAEQFGLKVIATDGTHFLHQLKARLVEDDLLFPDSVLERTQALNYCAEVARRVIDQSDWRSNAPLYYSLAYLDGIIDATGRSLAKAPSGDVMEKNHLAHIIKSYDQLLGKAIDRELWWDAAYVDGYRIALYSFFMDATRKKTADLTGKNLKDLRTRFTRDHPATASRRDVDSFLDDMLDQLRNTSAAEDTVRDAIRRIRSEFRLEVDPVTPVDNFDALISAIDEAVYKPLSEVQVK